MMRKCNKTLGLKILSRRAVLIPSPLQALLRFFVKGDKKFNQGLQESIDFLVSAFMIVTLLVTVLFGSIFLIFQVRMNSSSKYFLNQFSRFLDSTRKCSYDQIKQ